MSASDIGKGDWVRCICVRPDSRGEPVPLVLKAVYQVADTGIGYDAHGVPGPCVMLVGLADEAELDFVNRTVWLSAFDVDRFVPIYRRDESLIARLLSDVPTDIPVEA